MAIVLLILTGVLWGCVSYQCFVHGEWVAGVCTGTIPLTVLCMIVIGMIQTVQENQR
jgi:hypothetical protein